MGRRAGAAGCSAAQAAASAAAIAGPLAEQRQAAPQQRQLVRCCRQRASGEQPAREQWKTGALMIKVELSVSVLWRRPCVVACNTAPFQPRSPGRLQRAPRKHCTAACACTPTPHALSDAQTAPPAVEGMERRALWGDTGGNTKCLESNGRRSSLVRARLPSLCKQCDSPVPQALAIDRSARPPLSNVAPLCRWVGSEGQQLAAGWQAGGGSGGGRIRPVCGTGAASKLAIEDARAPRRAHRPPAAPRANFAGRLVNLRAASQRSPVRCTLRAME